MATLVGQTLGKYEIVAEIGGGGMAVVYKAYQPSLNRYVAIKVAREQFRQDATFMQRFLDEARTAARLQHPHIIHIYDVAQEGDIHYIVMDYVDGDSLAAKLRQEGPLDLSTALSILQQVGEALDYAHAEPQGVIHRDVKPSNILLARDGRAILCDFGIARAARESRLTGTGVTLGTAHYMAPEQAQADLLVDGRADLYSLGIVLYEMATGRVPFQADTPLAVLHKQVYEPPPAPAQINPSIPPAVEEVILRALEKDRDRRYQSGRDMFLALEQALGGKPADTELSGGRTRRWAPPPIPKPRPVASYVLLALAVALLGFLLLRLWGTVHCWIVPSACQPTPTPVSPTPTPAPSLAPTKLATSTPTYIPSPTLTRPPPTVTATPGLAKEIRLDLGEEPVTLDPNRASLPKPAPFSSIDCIQLLFMGLTTYDGSAVESRPWLATGWRSSAGGLVWTFDLRNDVYWVRYDPSSGQTERKRPVTAWDVEYGVRRAVNPKTASQHAYLDYGIRNAKALRQSQNSDPSSVGVRALDADTVEFTLTSPAGYFPAVAGHWINNPVPREAIEAYGDRWTEPGNIWTCGAYVLAAWQHGQSMVMKKNPFWFDAGNVSIEQIYWTMDESTRLARYEMGQLDMCQVPPSEVDSVRANPTLGLQAHFLPSPNTYYYGFNTTKRPFDNAKVRQAFSYAIDRQGLIDTVLKGGQQPASTFGPPGIVGSPAEDPAFPGIAFDPVRARALLAEAGFPNGQGLPEITIVFTTASEEHKRIAEFIQQNWRDTLGVRVELSSLDWDAYLGQLQEDAPQVHALSAYADLLDEHNLLPETFHPTKSHNYSEWSGQDAQEFARLTEEAAAENDPASRQDLYFQAEKILCVDSAVIAPLYHLSYTFCVKPYVEWTYTPIGGQHIYYWRVKAH